MDVAALDAIYDSAPVGLAVISLDGRFLRINRRLASINGLPVEDHVGRTLEEVVPALAVHCRDVIHRVTETGQGVYDWVIAGETASAPGVQRTWREQWSPLRDTNGAIVAINVVVEDITERQEAERSLVESAAFTRRVLDNLFTFVGVLDLEGNLVEVNRAPVEAAGLQSTDLLGRKFWDCYWWSYSQAEQTRLELAFAACLLGEVVRYDVPVRIAGGHMLWIDFQMAPLRDQHGTITHVIPSGNDIQARRIAEGSLRLQQAETEALLQSAPIGLAFFDRAYRYLRINKELADINGVSVDEHLGRTIAEVLPHAPPVTHLIDSVFATGKPIGSMEVAGETLRQPGVRRYWLTGFFPVEGPGGEVSVVGIWVVEITDRKRNEEQIKLLMREVNHRSKNILSVVQAIANQTLSRDSGPQAEKRFSARLQGLAASHDLLVHSGWTGVGIAELIRSQLSHFSDLVDSRILLHGTDTLISPAAAQAIGMALHELVTNASKYGALMGAEGKVDVSWGVEGDTFTLEWTESGGPPVAAPEKTGFGSLLLARLTGFGLGGQSSVDYDPAGVHWRLEIPAERLRGDADAAADLESEKP